VNLMFAALLLTALLAGSVSDEQAAQLPTQPEAEELAGQGKYQAALEAFRRRAAVNPNDLAARVWIGRLHEQMGKPELAEPVYRSVVWEAPNNVDAALLLGAMLVKQRRFDEAVRVLDRAAHAEPRNPEVLAAVGAAHLRVSNVKLGISYLYLAAAIAPTPENLKALDRARRAHRIASPRSPDVASEGVSPAGP
jgi:tetratricopeptide (TPR) repeat protein